MYSSSVHLCIQKFRTPKIQDIDTQEPMKYPVTANLLITREQRDCKIDQSQNRRDEMNLRQPEKRSRSKKECEKRLRTTNASKIPIKLFLQ